MWHPHGCWVYVKLGNGVLAAPAAPANPACQVGRLCVWPTFGRLHTACFELQGQWCRSEGSVSIKLTWSKASGAAITWAQNCKRDELPRIQRRPRCVDHGRSQQYAMPTCGWLRSDSVVSCSHPFGPVCASSYVHSVEATGQKALHTRVPSVSKETASHTLCKCVCCWNQNGRGIRRFRHHGRADGSELAGIW